MRLWRFHEMPAPDAIVIKELVLGRRLVVIDVWMDRARPRLRRVLLVFASCPRGSRWLYRSRSLGSSSPPAGPHFTTSYDKAKEWAEVEAA